MYDFNLYVFPNGDLPVKELPELLERIRKTDGVLAAEFNVQIKAPPMTCGIDIHDPVIEVVCSDDRESVHKKIWGKPGIGAILSFNTPKKG